MAKKKNLISLKQLEKGYLFGPRHEYDKLIKKMNLLEEDNNEFSRRYETFFHFEDNYEKGLCTLEELKEISLSFAEAYDQEQVEEDLERDRKCIENDGGPNTYEILKNFYAALKQLKEDKDFDKFNIIRENFNKEFNSLHDEFSNERMTKFKNRLK